MPAKYFTVEEANDLLPELEPLMADLIDRRARIVRSRNEIDDLISDNVSDVGGREASDLVLEFMAIERQIIKIRGYGCLLKDLNAGLIDFLSEQDGREVYLCWRIGEPKIEFFHELHTGFSDRKHL